MNKKNKKSTSYNSDSTFSVLEAYRSIRTNLMFTLSTSEKKAFIVTSANASEGKSTTSIFIARALSELGHRVLIIDADMRKPTIHKVLKLKNTVGLSDLLSKKSALSDVIHFNVFKKVDVITAGAIPPNPSELLGAAKYDSIMPALESVYDYIIFDTPPINIVTDAALLQPVCAGNLLVVRQRHTQYRDIKRATEALLGVNGKILGIVINDVETGNSYYSHSKYGYGKYGKYAKYRSNDEIV